MAKDTIILLMDSRFKSAGGPHRSPPHLCDNYIDRPSIKVRQWPIIGALINYLQTLPVSSSSQHRVRCPQIAPVPRSSLTIIVINGRLLQRTIPSNLYPPHPPTNSALSRLSLSTHFILVFSSPLFTQLHIS